MFNLDMGLKNKNSFFCYLVNGCFWVLIGSCLSGCSTIFHSHGKHGEVYDIRKAVRNSLYADFPWIYEQTSSAMSETEVKGRVILGIGGTYCGPVNEAFCIPLRIDGKVMFSKAQMMELNKALSNPCQLIKPSYEEYVRAYENRFNADGRKRDGNNWHESVGFIVLGGEYAWGIARKFLGCDQVTKNKYYFVITAYDNFADIERIYYRPELLEPYVLARMIVETK